MLEDSPVMDKHYIQGGVENLLLPVGEIRINSGCIVGLETI